MASSAAESAYGAPSVSRQEKPPMFAAWRTEMGSAVNFAATYGTDEMLLGGADDVRTLQKSTARSVRWKGFLSVGVLFLSPYFVSLANTFLPIKPLKLKILVPSRQHRLI